MAEINKATEKLLAAGWTKNQTPPGMRPWNDYEGGWTYDYRFRADVVFESPCGLLWKRDEVSHSGHMSFMGVEWTEENNCITVLCPYCDRDETCELNDPILESHPTGGCHYEHLCFCALHETSTPWDYARSARKVRDEQEAEQEARWEQFAERHNGRVCRNQCRYNRKTKEWSAAYDPIRCPGYACSYCFVIGKEPEKKKGNVFYDLKIVSTVKGEGLFGDETRTQIIKGKKLFDKPCSITICQAAAKACVKDIIWKEKMRYHTELFFKSVDSVEVLNVRAEVKESRDLLQDLQDVENGFRVEHLSDQQTAAKVQKSEKRREAAKKKVERLEKRYVAAGGMKGLNDYERRRIRKFVPKERFVELDRQIEENAVQVQQSLF